MSFWGDNKWTQVQASHKLIAPYNSNQLGEGCYRLAMGDEAIVSSSEQNARGTFINLDDKNFLTLLPGQFAYLITHETIDLPDDVIGFINVKTSQKFKGLVNISGFHVDPGYKGKLIFTVFNAGAKNIAVCKGDSIFRIWLSNIDPPVVPKTNATTHKCLPRDWVEDVAGVYPSPFALRDSVAKLESDVSAIQSQRKQLNIILLVVGAILLPFVAALYAEVFGPIFHKKYEDFFSTSKVNDETSASTRSTPAKPTPSKPPK